ncbi:MAG TPA: hypothetical protein VHA52_13340, partial [Candidatus Babeliaceae bacterium]|nr:hypothetical protein [Candidatus Babeliaceae bacterium]
KLAQSANKSAPNELPYHTLAAKAKVIQNNDTPVNPELYESCKREADIEYKKVMNKRAVLFSMADSEGFEDPNTEAKINDRSKLAIDIVTGYQKISDLYDRVNFVKSHGHLPDQGGIGEKEYISLPDHLVKLRLDNARKAYNKIKAKERTPKRVVLMQKHEENIKRLEEQWKSLKASLNL